MNEKDLQDILKRPGVALKSSLGGGVSAKIRFSRQVTDVERPSGLPPVQTEGDTLNYSGQSTLRIKFFRKRLADPDGNIAKYQTDFLRYCGALKDDNASEVRIILEGQVKVETEAEERTEIIVEYQGVDLNNLWIKKKL